MLKGVNKYLTKTKVLLNKLKQWKVFWGKKIIQQRIGKEETIEVRMWMCIEVFSHQSHPA